MRRSRYALFSAGLFCAFVLLVAAHIGKAASAPNPGIQMLLLSDQPQPVSLKIMGFLEVNENSDAIFSTLAIYNDGRVANVTSKANWSVDTGYASIRRGYLIAGEVPEDQPCAITASYGGKTATFHMVIKDYTLANVQEVFLNGPSDVNESSGAQYMLTIRLTDGSIKRLRSGPQWGVNCSHASIDSSGYLTTSAVAVDQSCTVTAKYGYSSASAIITIKDVNSQVSSLVINGPTTVNESSGAQYSCRANFADGSSTDVTTLVTWSENTAATSINKGYLTAGPVAADTPCRISADYGGKTATYDITVKNSANPAILRIKNNTPHAIIDLKLNGVPQINYPDTIPPHSQKDYPFADSGSIPVYLEVGRYSPSGQKESCFKYEATASIVTGQTSTVNFDVSLTDILTQWSQNHLWWTDYWMPGLVGDQVQNIYHMAWFTFKADGSWYFYNSDNNSQIQLQASGFFSLKSWPDNASQLTFSVHPTLEDAIMPFPFVNFYLKNGPEDAQGQHTILEYKRE
jgi:hypothetical protein